MDVMQGSRAPAGEPSATPLATASVQLGAALLLHVVLSLLAALLASPEVAAALGLRPLSVSAPGEILSGWVALTVGPAAAWAVLVLGRAMIQRAASGFWLALSAGLVAGASFALVLSAGIGTAPGPGPGMVAAAWLLVPCAIAIAALTALVAHWPHAPRARRTSRSTS